MLKPPPLLIAVGWEQRLHAGVHANPAAIARVQGLCRARITQIMNLLRLPQDTLCRLLSDLERGVPEPSERALRPLLDVRQETTTYLRWISIRQPE